MRLSIAIAATALAFLILDAIWLGVVAKDFYRQQIGHLLAPDFRLGPAILFYLVYLGGVSWFALAPAAAGGDWRAALLPAAILGFVAYATYDLTNWAVMRDWPAVVTVADIAWGTVLTTVAAGVGAYLAQRWG
ncbi:MAG: DUF2177 family protein [Methylobacteriaceae bacterium]|nr:DUF2177 family protein [Methylobacteriaceae bacterium]